MFPLRDHNPTERTPLVTVAIIAGTLFVWFGVQGAGLSERALTASVCRFGTIPAEITGGAGRAGPCALGGLTWETLLSSMFLHGGWGHLIGNLWFLWIFGNNVEDAMGRVRFVLFYGLAGVAAALAQVFTEPGSTLPMVGASGAISGVMGAYLVLYPRARIQTLLVLIVFITFVDIPAFVYLGYWFALQVVASRIDTGPGGGVAFAAHVGGFVAGLALVIPFRRRRPGDRSRASPPGAGGWR